MQDIETKAQILNKLVLTDRREEILRLSQELDLLIVKHIKHQLIQKNSI